MLIVPYAPLKRTARIYGHAQIKMAGVKPRRPLGYVKTGSLQATGIDG